MKVAMFWRFEKCVPSLSRNMVDKLGVGLSVPICLDKDSLHSECERKRAKYPTKYWVFLMIVLFPNSSRIYFYRQGDREAIIYTLTGDLNSESWFQNDCLIPLRHHSFMTSPSGEQTCWCLDDPLSPVWKCSLLQFFSASQSRRVWDLYHLSALPLSVLLYQLSHGHKCCGLGEPGAYKISFHDKEIVPQHAGLTIWPAWGSHAGSLSMAKWESPACFHPGLGRSTIVVKTSWCAKKSERAGLLSNCQSTKRGSSLQRPKFKQNTYMYTFLAYCLCLR